MSRKLFFTFRIRRGGYTLLELVVVVFIISLLAAVIFPSFSWVGESKLKSEAKKAASLLRYLNDSAISRKETYSLRFDIREGMLSWKGPDGEKKEMMRSLAGVRLSSKGTLKDGEVTLFFGPLGVAENTDILLEDKEEGLDVALNATSGRVTITPKTE